MDKTLGSVEKNPKAVSVVQPMFSDGMMKFANLRGEWMKRSLGGMVNRVEEIDEGGIWESGRAREKVRGLIDLWEVMVVVVEVSNALLHTTHTEPRRKHC